jgi:hypothetical protein
VAASNVFVNGDRTIAVAELRKQLVESAARRGNHFGIVIRRLSGNAATLAYRIYADGHEELIRNAELSGITIANFKDIVAVSDLRYVYTEATPQRAAPNMNVQIGAPPLQSYIVPALLFDDLSIVKVAGNSAKPPIADNPMLDKKTGP